MFLFQKSDLPCDLKGKNVIITCGMRGIGRATSIFLASKGAKLLIIGRGKRELDDALREIKRVSKDVVGLIADVAKKEDVKQVFDISHKELGEIDVLIDNAGLGAGNIMEMTYEEQKYVLQTNLFGYLILAKQAVKRMKYRGEGSRWVYERRCSRRRQLCLCR